MKFIKMFTIEITEITEKVQIYIRWIAMAAQVGRGFCEVWAR